MKNIYFHFGGTPVLFIRYNPDNYKVEGKTLKTAQYKREEMLIRWLKYVKERDNVDVKHCGVVYLFYDEYNETTTKPFEIDPYDTEEYGCEKCDKIFYLKTMYETHLC